MAEVFDFNKFKEMRESIDNLENDYLNFLPWINKKLGVPTDLFSSMKILFITLRFLEGTLNGFSILATLTNMNRDKLEEGKKVITDWLMDMIETVKNI